MWVVVQLLFNPFVISLLALSSTVSRKINTSTGYDLEVYSEFEMRKIERFRELMNDVLEKEYQRSDDFVIRWLRETDMDVNSASQMLKHALEWRKVNEMDSVLTTPSFNFKNPPYIVEGFDKRGGSVLYIKIAEVDLRKHLTIDIMDNLRNISAHCVEQYTQAQISGGTKSNEIRMTQGVAILDFQGVTVKQHACPNCVKLYQQLAIYSRNYYPRFTKHIAIINAPRYARPVIEIVRPILSLHYQKKIQIFGADKEE